MRVQQLFSKSYLNYQSFRCLHVSRQLYFLNQKSIKNPNQSNDKNNTDHSPISNAPNWDHDSATSSEQSVKADYEPIDHPDHLKKSTQDYLNKKYPIQEKTKSNNR